MTFLATYLDQSGGIKTFKFFGMDTSGEISAVAFGEKAKEVSKIIEVVAKLHLSCKYKRKWFSRTNKVDFYYS